MNKLSFQSMGASKLKWTSEEEVALRAGVEKYGSGKWRAIQKDPAFGPCLASRSNVDLKDKWRNMSVSANGWGSREKTRLALKGSSNTSKQTDRQLALSVATTGHTNAVVDATPLKVLYPSSHRSKTKRSFSRLENLIFEAVSSLKEPNGSNRSAIESFIEDHHSVPTNFRRLLSTKIRSLTSTGKLIKVRQNYIISDNATPVEETSPKGSDSMRQLAKGKPIRPPRVSSHRVKSKISAKKLKVDRDLAKLRLMKSKEAAKAAAQAVAEAEVAAAVAEQAAKEAEVAEAEAEAAQAFVEAAMMALGNFNKFREVVVTS